MSSKMNKLTLSATLERPKVVGEPKVQPPRLIIEQTLLKIWACLVEVETPMAFISKGIHADINTTLCNIRRCLEGGNIPKVKQEDRVCVTVEETEQEDCTSVKMEETEEEDCASVKVEETKQENWASVKMEETEQEDRAFVEMEETEQEDRASVKMEETEQEDRASVKMEETEQEDRAFVKMEETEQEDRASELKGLEEYFVALEEDKRNLQNLLQESKEEHEIKLSAVERERIQKRVEWEKERREREEALLSTLVSVAISRGRLMADLRSQMEKQIEKLLLRHSPAKKGKKARKWWPFKKATKKQEAFPDPALQVLSSELENGKRTSEHH